MIVEVLGYRFSNQQIANAYQTIVDGRYGFPNGDTLHYFQYSEGFYDGINFYWTLADDNLIPDMGQPYNFFIDNGL